MTAWLPGLVTQGGGASTSESGHNQRSLKDIAAETGIRVDALAAAARNAGIPVRHDVNGRGHPLASVGEQFARDVAPVLDMLAATEH